MLVPFHLSDQIFWHHNVKVFRDRPHLRQGTGKGIWRKAIKSDTVNRNGGGEPGRYVPRLGKNVVAISGDHVGPNGKPLIRITW